MNTGGTSGSVKSISTSASASTVKVEFPGPPVKTELYDLPNDSPFLRRFENAMNCGGTADVTCDASGGITTVTSKK